MNQDLSCGMYGTYFNKDIKVKKAMHIFLILCIYILLPFRKNTSMNKKANGISKRVEKS